MSDSDPFAIPESQPLLIVISGPSGVGKDSVIMRMKERRMPFYFVVTATTRLPRPDEQPGVDYIFVSKDQFAGLIERGELLEYAIVYNDYKGIPKDQVRQALQSGQDVILRIDVQGAATIRELCPDALTIFLAPESEAELIERLTQRKSETPEGLKLRIVTARQEMKRMGEFDYVVVNRDGNLNATVDAIIEIIHAEHHRVHPRIVSL
jgi:guanylate kinase